MNLSLRLKIIGKEVDMPPRGGGPECSEYQPSTPWLQARPGREASVVSNDINNNLGHNQNNNYERENDTQRADARGADARGADALGAGTLRAEVALRHSLRPVTISPDGNCMFSAFSHQIYGNPDQHGLLRETVCCYLTIHR